MAGTGRVGTSAELLSKFVAKDTGGGERLITKLKFWTFWLSRDAANDACKGSCESYWRSRSAEEHHHGQAYVVSCRHWLSLASCSSQFNRGNRDR